VKLNTQLSIDLATADIAAFAGSEAVTLQETDMILRYALDNPSVVFKLQKNVVTRTSEQVQEILNITPLSTPRAAFVLVLLPLCIDMYFAHQRRLRIQIGLVDGRFETIFVHTDEKGAERCLNEKVLQYRPGSY
jgi:hypothetical protein